MESASSEQHSKARAPRTRGHTRAQTMPSPKGGSSNDLLKTAGVGDVKKGRRLLGLGVVVTLIALLVRVGFGAFFIFWEIGNLHAPS